MPTSSGATAAPMVSDVERARNQANGLGMIQALAGQTRTPCDWGPNLICAGGQMSAGGWLPRISR